MMIIIMIIQSILKYNDKFNIILRLSHLLEGQFKTHINSNSNLEIKMKQNFNNNNIDFNDNFNGN